MNLHFTVDYDDLDFNAKEHLITSVKDILLERYEEEGERAIRDHWMVAPKTWQEAYCRDMAIDSSSWSDIPEESDEFQKFDWDFSLQNYAEEKAENALSRAFRYLEVEVEI